MFQIVLAILKKNYLKIFAGTHRGDCNRLEVWGHMHRMMTDTKDLDRCADIRSMPLKNEPRYLSSIHSP